MIVKTKKKLPAHAPGHVTRKRRPLMFCSRIGFACQILAVLRKTMWKRMLNMSQSLL